MKKRFFKIVAVMMAASMMSMTAYAAESAAELGEETQLTSAQENTEQQNTAEEPSQEQAQQP